MISQKIFSVLKKVIPNSILSPVRRIGTALVTPIHFSYLTGHFISSLEAKSVDKSRRSIPWYTYPATHFLEGLDFSHARVLEFGAGQSTMWWANRCEHVTSLEADAHWAEYVRQHAPANVTLHEVTNDLDGFESIIEDERFDVIVIDGLDRAKSAEKSVNLVKQSGIVIVDNSEGSWGAVGTYPIIDLFNQSGFARVDFQGFAPGVSLPHCTSLFFLEIPTLFYNVPPPGRIY